MKNHKNISINDDNKVNKTDSSTLHFIDAVDSSEKIESKTNQRNPDTSTNSNNTNEQEPIRNNNKELLYSETAFREFIRATYSSNKKSKIKDDVELNNLTKKNQQIQPQNKTLKHQLPILFTKHPTIHLKKIWKQFKKEQII